MKVSKNNKITSKKKFGIIKHKSLTKKEVKRNIEMLGEMKANNFYVLGRGDTLTWNSINTEIDPHIALHMEIEKDRCSTSNKNIECTTTLDKEIKYRVKPKKSKREHCPYCHTKLERDCKFCHYCGTLLQQPKKVEEKIEDWEDNALPIRMRRGVK
jgi:hypothetical protein